MMKNCEPQLKPIDGRSGPIGVFDSGFGGLTILQQMRRLMPDYDYIYLGDNARAPYGVRSFDVVYRFTLQAVEYLFRQGCPLVILACNTASAKALRNIQQMDLPRLDPTRRVLGVIRPTAETIGMRTTTGSVGIMGTVGTVQSRSYDIEIGKLYPEFKVYSQACPLWVPLIENAEINTPATDYFVERYTGELLSQSEDIDTIVLACTHYPMLIDKIRKALPTNVDVVTQGEIVATSLVDYLRRHPEMDRRLTRSGECRFTTTESSERFSVVAELFLNHPVVAHHVDLA